jgi:hypothetical protein
LEIGAGLLGIIIDVQHIHLRERQRGKAQFEQSQTRYKSRGLIGAA